MLADGNGLCSERKQESGYIRQPSLHAKLLKCHVRLHPKSRAGTCVLLEQMHVQH